MLRPDMVIIDNVLDDVPLSVIPFYLHNYGKFKEKTISTYYFRKRLNRYNIGLLGVVNLVHSKFTRRYNDYTQEGLLCYEAILESLVLLAKGMGCKVILLSCGIDVDRNHNMEVDNPKRKMLELHFPEFTASAVVNIIEEYNRIVKKVAEKNNVIFIDMSQVASKDDKHFVDATHRSDKGNEIFASVLMEELIAHNLFD